MESLRRPRKHNSRIRKSSSVPRHVALTTLSSLLAIPLLCSSLCLLSSCVFFCNYPSFRLTISPCLRLSFCLSFLILGHPPSFPFSLSVPLRPPNPLISVYFHHIVTNQRMQLCKNLCVCAQAFLFLCTDTFLGLMCLRACLCAHGHNIHECVCFCACMCTKPLPVNGLRSEGWEEE